jgi:oligoendopeptidase F
MTRAYLLNTNPSKSFQIALLEEAMSNFHRYFFVMPTLARFELETHQRIEQGNALTADSMIELMADLFSEGFGESKSPARVGMVWSTFSHLFSDYYVYQYDRHYRRNYQDESCAAKRMPPNCLGFLKAGGSAYPLRSEKSGRGLQSQAGGKRSR